MKVHSHFVKYTDWKAYCSTNGCQWEHEGDDSRVKARRHAEKTGHRVEVFGERFYVVKPVIVRTGMTT